MRVPRTARKSNQSILKEASPECSLEGLMLKLKPQYFGHLMRRVDSLEKTLMLGGIGRIIALQNFAVFCQKIKFDTVSTVSPSISHEVMGPDAMIFSFLIVEL